MAPFVTIYQLVPSTLWLVPCCCHALTRRALLLSRQNRFVFPFRLFTDPEQRADAVHCPLLVTTRHSLLFKLAIFFTDSADRLYSSIYVISPHISILTWRTTTMINCVSWEQVKLETGSSGDSFRRSGGTCVPDFFLGREAHYF